MTTNSCGSALPVFDFAHHSLGKLPKRVIPISARLVPIVAVAALATYYVGSQVSSTSSIRQRAKTFASSLAKNTKIDLSGQDEHDSNHRWGVKWDHSDPYDPRNWGI